MTVLVEVTRGARVESLHHGAAVVVDADGGVVFAAGDIAQAVYPRSAVKSMLALPLVESGAADRLGLTEAEIALACSSHSGEAVHVAAAASMLRKAGRDESSLECGAHWPGNEAAMHALVRAGGKPGALHNNCSGKHSGFVCLACDRGDDPKGYVQPEHPTMREVTAALSALTSTVLDEHNRAVDGCSIPTFAIPLRALALAFARFGTGNAMGAQRAAAAQRIRAAVAANPMMVAGTGRFCTRLMTLLGERVFAKSGAEGVYCAAIPELGLGIAVKCDDGAGRAAEVATAALVARFLPNNGAVIPELAAMATPELRNWNGIHVGALRPGAVLAMGVGA
jgi:L-asparaginase II